MVYDPNLKIYLGKTICMSSNDSDITRLWIRVIERNVLLHRELWGVGIAMSCCCDMISGVAAIDRVLNHSVE